MAAPSPSALRALRLAAALVVASAAVARAGGEAAAAVAAMEEVPARNLTGSRGETSVGAAIAIGLALLVPMACCAVGARVNFGALVWNGQPQPEAQPEAKGGITLVTLDRSGGAALGVGLSDKQGHLLITRIHEEGLVAEWNKTHPVAQLRVGDMIVAVNGASGSGEALLAQCKKTVALRISVVPAGMQLPQSLGWRDAYLGERGLVAV